MKHELTEKQITRLVKRHLIPFDQLDRIAKRLGSGTLSSLESAMTSHAETLAFRGYYFGMRGGFGCGDHGHDAAIDAANWICDLIVCCKNSLNRLSRISPLMPPRRTPRK